MTTASFVIRLGTAFILAVAVTTRYAASGGAVGRGGAAEGPLDNTRAAVATASDVGTTSRCCNMNESAPARWRLLV